MPGQDDDQRLFEAVFKPIDSKYEVEDANIAIKVQHNPPGTEHEAWQKCYELAGRYDKGLCDAYREEIDTLLVFAGLFSAVVTAFTVESYQWLHDDSGDVSVQLLAQIATILNHSTPVLPSATSALSDAIATRINVYWFVSLVLSLSAALVGILAKQWIREYSRDAGRTHPESLGVRQMKLEGLEAWKVSEIVTSVPLLLQAALALFFLGIIELLWQLSVTVAAPVTTVIFLALCFYVATTVLPAFHLVHWDLARGTMAQCPYKSPQAWLALRATIWSTKSSPYRPHCDPSERKEVRRYEQATQSVRQAGSWIMLDLAWTVFRDAGSAITRPEFSFQALAWLRQALNHSDMHNLIWHCLQHAITLKGFTHRSSSDILRCMPKLSNRLPGSPPICDTDRRTQCQFHLLTYALSASMPPETYVDLLCQVFFKAEKNKRLTEQDYSALSGWFSQIPTPREGLPEAVLDDLFRVVYYMTERRIAQNVAIAILTRMNFVLGYNHPSQHQTRLTLAFCARARWWLDAKGPFGRGLQAGDAASRANLCTYILRSSMFNIRKLPYEVEDGPPYSPETIVFAYLARDIDAYVQDQQLRDHPALWSTHDVVVKLVDVASSYLGGSMLSQPEGPLIDDPERLSDCPLIDVEDSPDVSASDTAARARQALQSEAAPALHSSAVPEHLGAHEATAVPPLAPEHADTLLAAGHSESGCPRGDSDSTMHHHSSSLEAHPDDGGESRARVSAPERDHDAPEASATPRETGARDSPPSRTLHGAGLGSVAALGSTDEAAVSGMTRAREAQEHLMDSADASIGHSEGVSPDDNDSGLPRSASSGGAPTHIDIAAARLAPGDVSDQLSATRETARVGAGPGRLMHWPETRETDSGPSGDTLFPTQMSSPRPAARGRPNDRYTADAALLSAEPATTETERGERDWDDLEAGLVRGEGFGSRG